MTSEMQAPIKVRTRHPVPDSSPYAYQNAFSLLRAFLPQPCHPSLALFKKRRSNGANGIHKEGTVEMHIACFATRL